MLKQLVITIAFLSFLGTFSFAQENPGTEKKEKHKCMEESSGCCSTHHSHSEMKMEDSKEKAAAKPWNEVCPIRGGDVDSEVTTVEYDGKEYGFCCGGCDKKFSKDPEKFSKNLSEDGKKFIGKKK